MTRLKKWITNCNCMAYNTHLYIRRNFFKRGNNWQLIMCEVPDSATTIICIYVIDLNLYWMCPLIYPGPITQMAHHVTTLVQRI